MKFSLILATLNRHKEVKECLTSLEQQEYKDFEVLVIDQSDDTLTKEVVSEFNDISIQYFKVDFKGLSRARNFGLQYARGEYCCLLDDDATYSKQYLAEANRLIVINGGCVLSGKILSMANHNTPFVRYKEKKDGCELNATDIMAFCPSAALIFPAKSIIECGFFDERLGVGNKYASGEETDFLLRLYDKGYKIIFCNSMIAYHPIKPVCSLEPLYNHYLGKGALFKIDLLQRKKIRLISLFAKNTLGMLIKAYILDRKSKDIYLTRLKGFIDGLVTFKL